MKPAAAILVIFTLSSIKAQQATSCSQAPQPVTSTIAVAGTAIAGTLKLNSISMVGNVVEHSGRNASTGTITLEAESSGATSIITDISGKITTETNSQTNDSKTCKVVHSDGTSTTLSSSNCWTASPWFFPHLMLAAQTPPAALHLQDFGTCSDSTGTYRRVHHYLSLNSPQSDPIALSRIQTWSAANIDLDPATLLPVKLDFTSHADKPADRLLNGSVEFSDYRQISGVSVPFRIKKFLSGALILDITVTAATIH